MMMLATSPPRSATVQAFIGSREGRQSRAVLPACLGDGEKWIKGSMDRQSEAELGANALVECE